VENISIEKLNRYNIVYKTISPSGILGVSYQKEIIEADNKESAVDILRASVSKDSGCSIRMSKIEKLNLSEKDLSGKTDKRPKRSLLGWFAASMILLAGIAKLIDRLF